MFLLRSLTVTLTVLLFCIYLSWCKYMFCNGFPSIGKFWSCGCHSFNWLYIKLKTGCLFHYITYDYFCASWGGLWDHLRDVPWTDIFNSVLLLLLVKFVSGFRLELMLIPFTANIRWSLTHLHGFQLLLLLL